ncbi:MAG TPA: aspartate ammonia-lyase [Anaeromyxobacteraceae bacterium]|nr:aspartate ammonia-lyase [Anaeromyxobacteraceae bacterium]
MRRILASTLALSLLALPGLARAQAKASQFRVEKDLLGEKQIPADAYYGVQTARALENFQISGITLKHFPELVRALALVKLAAARANHDVGALPAAKLAPIEKACLAVMDGKYLDQFPVDMYQGGAGTSTNMNANEVLANIALETMGLPKGRYDKIEPHDDLNMSQSTNDFYPTALKVAMVLYNQELMPEVEQLAASFRAKGKEFADIIKMGRTETQDAVPMTLGQEFDAFAAAIETELAALRKAEEGLYVVNMGATAIGTGLNAPKGYSDKCVAHLAKLTGKKITLAPNLIAATSDLHAFAAYSSALRNLGAKLVKVSSDLQFLSSGPRTGISEIALPPVQPGSSIMPGKVNPVMAELMNSISFKVMGNDVALGLATSFGLLQLNAYEPLAAIAILESQHILIRGIASFRTKCVDGIVANRAVCEEHFDRSVGIVTALNPLLGYEKTTELAAEAMRTNKSVLQLVREQRLLTEEQIKKVMNVKALTGQQ